MGVRSEKTVGWLVVLCWACLAGIAAAELQNVETGGSIEILGGYYSHFYAADVDLLGRTLPLRALGPFGLRTDLTGDNESPDLHWVEQRTRLHLSADFTDNVKGFVEFDAITNWGDGSLRSDYLTGVDKAGAADLKLFQAYVEANEMYGYPLRLRIGRQAMTFGSGWLVGENPLPNVFTGLSFDGVRLSYLTDKLDVDAWWSKLVETSPAEEDGDVDFYGIHAAYKGIKDIELSLYWMYVRDARNWSDLGNAPTLLSDFAGGRSAAMEQLFGKNQFAPTNLHTIGARAAGKSGALDFEVEAAYQFGNADQLGATFFFPGWPYGDPNAEWGNWAGHFNVGYTFEKLKHTPHVYLEGHYYGGEDNRSTDSLGALLAGPRASVSFNRLFSDGEWDAFIDSSDTSNCWMLKAGVDAPVTETLTANVSVQYIQAIKAFAWPLGTHNDREHTPLLPILPCLTEEGAKDIGWEFNLVLDYQYSKELLVEIGYSHLWPGEGFKDGAFIDDNGLKLVGGANDNGADYVYFYTSLTF